MKLIDEYLDTLYKKDNNKSTLELKQEMRDHLIESVNDLKLQGLNDEEACKKAIEKFITKVGRNLREFPYKAYTSSDIYDESFNILFHNYINRGLWRAMVGSSNFSNSFIAEKLT